MSVEWHLRYRAGWAGVPAGALVVNRLPLLVADVRVEQRPVCGERAVFRAAPLLVAALFRGPAGDMIRTAQASPLVTGLALERLKIVIVFELSL